MGGKPTILWSGNGVHICQPVEAIILEQESKFAQFDQPSQTFLRFAAQFLSNHKSDTNNNPAFKSCLLRVPGSYNSKCTVQNREVNIIQQWDGLRPTINPLYYHFYIYLADRKLKEFNNNNGSSKLLDFMSVISLSKTSDNLELMSLPSL